VLAGRLAAAPAGDNLPPQLEGRERVGWDEGVGEAAKMTARKGVRRGAVRGAKKTAGGWEDDDEGLSYERLEGKFSCQLTHNG